MASVADALAALLRQGQEAREIRPDLDPHAGAWWLLSLLSAHRFRAAVLDDRTAVEPQLTALAIESLVHRPAGT